MKYHTIMVELTTRCNMKCVYCELSHSHWDQQDMSESCLHKIINFTRNNQIHTVCLHGHGEMTVVPDWHLIAKEFYDTGAKLTTCTNLAKVLTSEEIEMFAKFESITVSLDAIDTTLFRSLRRGGDIRNILYNMATIQSAAREENHSIFWIWNVVVCNKNIGELLTICKMAATFGVKSITFCNLVKLSPVIPEAVDILHPAELTLEEIQHTVDEITKCRNYCRANNIELACDSIIEALQDG